MPKFKVAVEWSSFGIVQVEATSLKEAVAKVKKSPDNYSLPTDSEYIDGSFAVNSDMSVHQSMNNTKK